MGNMFNTTKATNREEYFETLAEPRKSEILKIDKFIRETVPDLKPFVISGMLGYGLYHYKSKSGREGDWFIIGLASPKNYISVYVCSGRDGKYLAEIYGDRLGKADCGKSCIRYKKIEDINWDGLKEILIEAAEINEKTGGAFMM